jgi:hypothetical protein
MLIELGGSTQGIRKEQAVGHRNGGVGVRELAPTFLPDKHQEIVVYCANFACHAPVMLRAS